MESVIVHVRLLKIADFVKNNYTGAQSFAPALIAAVVLKSRGSADIFYAKLVRYITNEWNYHQLEDGRVEKGRVKNRGIANVFRFEDLGWLFPLGCKFKSCMAENNLNKPINTNIWL